MPCLIVIRTDDSGYDTLERMSDKLFLQECPEYGSIKVIFTNNKSRNILEVDCVYMRFY